MTIANIRGMSPALTNAPEPDAREHVRVTTSRFGVFNRDLGSAPVATRLRSLSLLERQTILDIDRGARTLGLVGTGTQPITVMMRNGTANLMGPYASGNRVGVPSSNVLGRVAPQRPNGAGVRPTEALYPYDVALHELAHVVQAQTLDSAGMNQLEAATRTTYLDGLVTRSSSHPNGSVANRSEASAIREGLSDAMAAVVTHDWVMGEEYFEPGSSIRAIRDVANPLSTDVFGTIETDYRHARAALDQHAPASREVDGVKVDDVEPHSVGGIISRSVYEFQQLRGWEDATTLVSTLQRDQALWKEGGTLEAYRDRFLAAARMIEAEHPDALADARSALRAVGYDVADDATGSPATPPSVERPSDPGRSTPGPADLDERRPDANLRIALSVAKGAAVGAGVGLLIGSVTRLNRVPGAILGAAIGAAYGGASGVAHYG